MIKKQTARFRPIDQQNIDTGACLKGLTLEFKDQSLLLDDKNSIRIGRSETQDLTINDPSVSSQQCLILRNEDNSHNIMDLDSKNGTRVNGERIKMTRLSNGDIIQFGPVEFLYYTGPSQLPSSVNTFIQIDDNKKSVNHLRRLTPNWFFNRFRFNEKQVKVIKWIAIMGLMTTAILTYFIFKIIA